MALVSGVLAGRGSEDVDLVLVAEDRPLEIGKVLVFRQEPVSPGPPDSRLFLEAGFAGEVHVQPWHLVEADNEIHRVPFQILLYPLHESPIASWIGPATCRHDHCLDEIGRRRVPLAGVRPNVVAAMRAGGGNVHELARVCMVRQDPEDAKRHSKATVVEQFHVSNSATSIQTRSGFSRAKQAGSTCSPRQVKGSPVYRHWRERHGAHSISP